MSSMEEKMWNERFSADDYAYGTEPNRFFKEQLDKLTPGKLFLPAEGEGRNAVYAAKKNWIVDAVDFSEEGKAKALKLASSENVKMNYSIHNLSFYIPPQNYYDAAAVIFLHMNKQETAVVFPHIVQSLKPGGTLIVEVFSKNKPLSYKGGPKDPDFLYNKEDLQKLFTGLETIILQETKAVVDEGQYHSGEAVVIRYLGKRI